MAQNYTKLYTQECSRTHSTQSGHFRYTPALVNIHTNASATGTLTDTVSTCRHHSVKPACPTHMIIQTLHSLHMLQLRHRYIRTPNMKVLAHFEVFCILDSIGICAAHPRWPPDYYRSVHTNNTSSRIQLSFFSSIVIESAAWPLLFFWRHCGFDLSPLQHY